MLEQVIVNGITAGFLYALTGLGFALVFESCGFADLSQGGLYLVGFYITQSLVIRSWPPVIAILLALSCASGLALLLYAFVYRRLRAVTRGTVPLLIGSLAVLSLIQNAVAIAWGPDTASLRASFPYKIFVVGTAHFTSAQILAVFVSVAAFIAVGSARIFTSWGRNVRATACDPELALLRGIATERATMLTVAVAAAMTASAAIVGGLDTDMRPSAAFPAVLIAWVVTVLGGRGRLAYTSLAGLLLGLLQHVPTLWVSSAWQDPVMYVCVLAILLFRPRGLIFTRSSPLNI